MTNLSGGKHATQRETRVPCRNSRGALQCNLRKATILNERGALQISHLERSSHGTIRQVQLTTCREEPAHHIWRRSPHHTTNIEEHRCQMQLGRNHRSPDETPEEPRVPCHNSRGALYHNPRGAIGNNDRGGLATEPERKSLP